MGDDDADDLPPLIEAGGTVRRERLRRARNTGQDILDEGPAYSGGAELRHEEGNVVCFEALIVESAAGRKWRNKKTRHKKPLAYHGNSIDHAADHDAPVAGNGVLKKHADESNDDDDEDGVLAADPGDDGTGNDAANDHAGIARARTRRLPGRGQDFLAVDDSTVVLGKLVEGQNIGPPAIIKAKVLLC